MLVWSECRQTTGKRSVSRSSTLCLILLCQSFQMEPATSGSSRAPPTWIQRHVWTPQHFTQGLQFVQQMTLSAEQSPQPHLPIVKQRKDARTEKETLKGYKEPREGMP